jgi:hypothetical protein
MLRHLLLAALAASLPVRADGFHSGGPTRESESVTCHLPEREHLRNSSGRDGLGLCVFTSIDLAARWANEPSLIGFRDFMTSHPGGGWPEKVDEYIPKMAASKGLPVPGYVQHTGGDPEFLKRALRTGRYVCVTYDGRDNVYYRFRIAHMVNLVHFTDQHAVVQDNNYPGLWLWMSSKDFLARWRGMGGGWAIALLKGGPPPIPVNAASTQREGMYLTVAHTLEQEADPSVNIPIESNYGIDSTQISKIPCYRLNGRSVSEVEAFAALDSLPDDSSRLRLTIIGDEELRRKVRADLEQHPGLNALRERLIVQDYPRDHWAVADVGFAPGITLQMPSNSEGKGAVLWRMPAYSGPEFMAGAIRKADPNYVPDKDPDPSSNSKAPAITNPLPHVPSECWYGLGGLLLALLARRFNIPFLQKRAPDIRDAVREILIDLLKPTPPPPSPDEEVRKLIQGRNEPVTKT